MLVLTVRPYEESGDKILLKLPAGLGLPPIVVQLVETRRHGGSRIGIQADHSIQIIGPRRQKEDGDA